MLRKLIALVPLSVTVGLLSAPAQAATPGRFTGYAFDRCQTPSQSQMDRWRERSPYWAVGVYIAGDSRYCKWELPGATPGSLPNPHLTPEWVSTQTRKGWRVLPITVGRQASCFAGGDEDTTYIDDDPANSYAAAKAQGRAEANTAVAASRHFGIAPGSTQWLDIEAFDTRNDDCRRSMLSFVSGWTARLHRLGYRSGFYSSAASGITAIEGARTLSPGSYRLPDQIWVAHYNGKATTGTSYLPRDAWRGQRIHQYLGTHVESYGRVGLDIDSNWMQVGGGSRAPRPSAHCGVRIDFASYGVLRRGSTGQKVKALQCLLRQRHLLSGPLTGHFDRRTARAVERFQHRQPPLRETGTANRSTWTALLSVGRTPFMKVGSASNGVRRLQRALNAATTSRLVVSGVYDKPTARAVKRYQRARALPRTGVTTDPVWADLHDGRR